jgi:methylated-DNA-[protein]-cysteine S-methyltransferase
MPRVVVDSPVGPLGLVASDEALRAVLFDGSRIRPEGRSPVLDEAARQLDAYFAGDLVAFDLALELHGTEFQRRCWLALGTIPYGQNPLPLVLPCHRVIGANGTLTGFGGGLHVKRFLLEHEGALLRLG